MESLRVVFVQPTSESVCVHTHTHTHAHGELTMRASEAHTLWKPW